MPELPGVIADIMTPLFAKTARVVHTQRPAARLIRVRFQADALRGTTLAAHDHVEFRVDRRCFRHYSPAAFDAAEGTLDVAFFLHDNGPGSRWAQHLAPGDAVELLGPGAGRFRVVNDAARHRLLGDETCLGVAEWMQHTLPHLDGALELAKDLLRAGEEGPLEALLRTQAGDALVDWQRHHPASPDQAVYLCGHAKTIQRLRAALREQGHPRRLIRTDPFWADGKRGL